MRLGEIFSAGMNLGAREAAPDGLVARMDAILANIPGSVGIADVSPADAAIIWEGCRIAGIENANQLDDRRILVRQKRLRPFYGVSDMAMR